MTGFVSILWKATNLLYGKSASPKVGTLCAHALKTKPGACGKYQVLSTKTLDLCLKLILDLSTASAGTITNQA